MGKGLEEGPVGSGSDGGVDNGEGDRTMVVDKDFEADREARVGFSQKGGGQVGPPDTDKFAFGVGGRQAPWGIESPGGSGERRRPLG